MLLVAAPARNSPRPTLAGPPEAIPMMSNRAGIILCIAITPGMNGWVGGWEKRREGEQGKGRVLSFDERDFGTNGILVLALRAVKEPGPLKSLVL
jgi:hypothetical protein